MINKDYDFGKMGNQIHAGTTTNGQDVWHTDSHGLWWSGNHAHRTTEELYRECLTTITDLLQHYPHLAEVCFRNRKHAQEGEEK